MAPKKRINFQFEDLPDVQFGNLHPTSIFTKRGIKLSKTPGIPGKWKVPFKPGLRALPFIDAITGIVQIINEQNDVKNSSNPIEKRREIEYDNSIKRSVMTGSNSPRYTTEFRELANGGFISYSPNLFSILSGIKRGARVPFTVK